MQRVFDCVKMFFRLFFRKWDWCDFRKTWVRRSIRHTWRIAWYVTDPRNSSEQGGI